MRRRDDGSIRVGKKVVAVRALGDSPDGIPEGSTGVVKVVDGLTWFRYWVKWDTGQWSAWVGDDDVVRVDRLAAWREEQAAAAEKATAAVAAAPTGESAAGSADAQAATGGVPPHLLARSEAARARRAAAG